MYTKWLVMHVHVWRCHLLILSSCSSDFRNGWENVACVDASAFDSDNSKATTTLLGNVVNGATCSNAAA